ncbi:hypothetical protein E2C01_063947 [Portunus trituberculatus]|uniref:Uncharacterized protein n=1 Tax=Portunus trituberculatus TaxID=210409 RepID=A0A5B7HIF7_PORTR|nr:hypothetical protein [Portunus trituberculatus]
MGFESGHSLRLGKAFNRGNGSHIPEPKVLMVEGNQT